VDRLRKHSRVLEPDQRINTYRHWGAMISELEATLARLSDLTDPDEFRSGLCQALERTEGKRDRKNQRPRVVGLGLFRFDLVGLDLTRELLTETFASLRASIPMAAEFGHYADLARTLDVAARAAVFYRLRGEFMEALTLYERFLESFPVEALVALEELTAAVVTGLFALGLCEEADQFLEATSQRLLRDRPSGEWSEELPALSRLCCLLAVSAGWYAFGWDRLADPFIQAARSLLEGDMAPRYKSILLCATNAAVRMAERPTADDQFRWTFAHVRGIRDTYTTSSHFSVSVLEVIESLVLAAVEVCSRR
jgi:hypothetical protein